MKRTLAFLVLSATSAIAQPVVTAVVDGAAYTNGIAQGSVFVVKGTGLSGAGYVTATAPTYPTTLNGVKISLTGVSGGGVVLPLMASTYNVGGVNQLVAVLPSNAAVGPYDLRVENGSAASAPFRTSVVARKPGIVTASSDGAGQAQATLDGKLILQRPANVGKLGDFETRSAHLGERVDLWGTGLGPDLASDIGGTSGDQTAAGQIRVLVNGVEVTPVYAGRSQGYPGLDQIVFTLPAGTALSCFVSIQVRSGGVLSNAVTIASATGDACPATPAVRINEVESNGGTPGDWVELYNPGPGAVNLAGFGFKDNDDTHAMYVLPASAVVPAGGYLVIEEADFGFGLGSPDSARLFRPDGSLADSYGWTPHAATTYGRCGNGTGAFTTTTSSTKGTANDCGIPVKINEVESDGGTPGDWVELYNPGATAIDLSGFTFRDNARNGPGTLFRLVFNGTIWAPDTANNWSAGKAVRYPDGTGDPDSEGVTFAGARSSEGIYISTERNNAANSVSRNSILRFDPSATGATLTATHEWNLTADLPVVGANLGMEAITWIPDTFLVARGFIDESKNRAYNPADYANHGTGLFFVGLEANGMIYAYALNHTGGGFTRIATINSGQAGVMDLNFDRDSSDLWSVCDDTCQGRSVVLRIDTTGKFTVARRFERPTGMPNLNNEGFAIAPASQCVANAKPVFWSDDSETDGHAIRTGTLTCSVL